MGSYRWMRAAREIPSSMLILERRRVGEMVMEVEGGGRRVEGGGRVEGVRLRLGACPGDVSVPPPGTGGCAGHDG